MRTCLVALAALAVGCTAAKANIQLISAEQALLRADSEGAEEVAGYEYTMAKRYLEKAREEVGYSEYRVADALARQSAEWSDRAIIFVERRGRTDINLDDFSAVPAAVPPPSQPPPTVPDDIAPGEEGKPTDEDLFAPVEPDLDPDPDPEPEPEPNDDFEMDDDDIEVEGGR